MRRNINTAWQKATDTSRALVATMARAWPKSSEMIESKAGQARLTMLWAEMILVFAGVPFILSFVEVSRRVIHGTLWILTVYALIVLTRSPTFSWRRVWEGSGWPEESRRKAIRRFLFIAPALFVLTWTFDPAVLFRFPLERPGFWALVMLLYPPLSVVPQEFMCRSFFFERYKDLLPRPAMMIAMNALMFGFVHIVFHNWFGPLISGIGGIIFAMSYQEHRSLKWVSIEHAVYGCFVFTLGLGWYFFRPVWP